MRAAWLAALLGAASGCGAQEYPARPITMIVPFAPGGPTDIVARVVAQKMSPSLGQQVLVTNLPGGGGSVGTMRVAGAKPDGYTVLMGNMGTHVLARATSSKLPYEPQKDFAPVSLVSNSFSMLVARKGLPASAKALIAYIRESGGRASYSTPGVGSVSHIVCAVFLHQIGATALHVPYKSAGLAVQDVVRGEIDFNCTSPVVSRPFVESGAIVALAYGGDSRSPLLPAVPTTTEQGIGGFDLNAWQGLFAPAGTPPAFVARLNAAVNEAQRDPAVLKQYTDLGFAMPALAERTPDAFARLIARNTERWVPILRTMDLPRE